MRPYRRFRAVWPFGACPQVVHRSILTRRCEERRLFSGLTWGVAFAAEASAIRTGVPFGWYCYLEATPAQELWIAGVPAMDSLSFTFLIYAGYALAGVLLRDPTGAGEPTHRPGRRCQRLHQSPSGQRMTSSAERRREGGSVRPSACAVLRLRISSNCVGCSTGKSLGLAPLRIRST